MARILPFSTPGDRTVPDDRPMATTGTLVAMRDVDLQTVIETVRFLRDIGRGHLLDGFNRPPTPADPAPLATS